MGNSPSATAAARPLREHVLRLSVTGACNLRCAYCRPIQPAKAPVPLGVARLAELALFVGKTVALKTIRITGGEPTLRRDLPQLVARLNTLKPRPELALTSNASRLATLAQPLREAGLDRLNISLDTLDPGRYRTLTRGGVLSRALAGIAAAHQVGLQPLKINAVLRRSSWQQDVPALLDYAQEHGYQLRFLELMTMGSQAGWSADEFISAQDVRAWLGRECGPITVLPATDAPARPTLMSWRGQTLEVGWISPTSKPFCARCTRLRIDSQGHLRRCLMERSPFRLHEALAEHPPEDVRRDVLSYLAGKTPAAAMHNSTPMSHIGG